MSFMVVWLLGSSWYMRDFPSYLLLAKPAEDQRPVASGAPGIGLLYPDLGDARASHWAADTWPASLPRGSLGPTGEGRRPPLETPVPSLKASECPSWADQSPRCLTWGGFQLICLGNQGEERRCDSPGVQPALSPSQSENPGSLMELFSKQRPL